MATAKASIRWGTRRRLSKVPTNSTSRSRRTTGVDVDGDGVIDEDEIEIEETIAVREDLLEELEELEAEVAE